MRGRLMRDLVALSAGRSRSDLLAELAAVATVTGVLWLAGYLFLLLEPTP